MPAVSIVIPTLGRSGSLPAVLAALSGQVTDAAEVLVVLDAAAPDDAPFPDVWGGGFKPRVTRAPRPGASAARNAGWRSANAPLVLFLDDDIVPVPTLVAEHVECHRRHPAREVGVLGLVRWSPRVRVTPFMRWLEMGVQFDYRTIDGSEVGWQRFYSCNLSIKREMLELVGGFDEERFPFGYEDLELGRRLSEHGFRLRYQSTALGQHLKTETLETWRRNLRRIARAERRFTELYPGERAYFFERFQEAAAAPGARGRSARLARLVGPDVPWLGQVVWRSYDRACMQRLAPEFLAEWDAAAGTEEGQ